MSDNWLSHYSEVEELFTEYGFPDDKLIIRPLDTPPTQKITIVCVIKNVDNKYKMSEALKRLGHYRFMWWQHDLQYPDSDRMDACVILMGTIQYLNTIPYHYLPVERIYTSDLDQYCSVVELEALKHKMMERISTGKYIDGYVLISPIRQELYTNLAHLRDAIDVILNSVIEDGETETIERMRTIIGETLVGLIELEKSCSIESDPIQD